MATELWWHGSRVLEQELLDTASPEDARQSLADLVRLNRYLGGHAVIRGLLRQVASPGERFSLLDVGAASGDSARFIRSIYSGAAVTCLDRNPVNLEAAPEPKVLGDAFALPFADASFDFAFSSLFLHHFTDAEVVALLREFGRVARRAVLISDLDRHGIAYWFLPATRWLFGWHPLSVHDGKISVRAAFTSCELKTLAQQAELEEVKIAKHRPAFRISMIGKPGDRKAGV